MPYIGPDYSECSAKLFSNSTTSIFEAAIAAESSTGTWTTVGTDGSNTPGRLYLLRGGSSVGQGALGLLNGG